MEYTLNPKNSGNSIVRLTFNFSLDIIKFNELLKKQKKFEIAGQVLRSGTSIGANVTEAQSAESSNDFIHKMKIAMKELKETNYWLFLCSESEEYPTPTQEIEKLDEIGKVLNKIIFTSVENRNKAKIKK